MTGKGYLLTCPGIINLSSMFDLPINRLVWDNAICTSVTTKEELNDLVVRTFGKKLVVNNVPNCAFTNIADGFGAQLGSTSGDPIGRTIFKVGEVQIPKKLIFEYEYNATYMGNCDLVFSTSKNRYSLWNLSDGHYASGQVSRSSYITTNNYSTNIREFSTKSTATHHWTDVIDVATQCPNCFTDGETICSFSFESVVNYAGYTANPVCIKRLEFVC